MVNLLRKMGVEAHPVDTPTRESAPAGEGLVNCSRFGEPRSRMAKPPFPGPLGKKVFDNVSLDAWNEWMSMGTKVINELRLDLTNPDHCEVYDQHMIEFLNLASD